MAKIKIAAVQMEHKDRDKGYNLGVIESLSQRASKEKVELYSFPKNCITGYMYIETLSLKEVLSIAESKRSFHQCGKSPATEQNMEQSACNKVGKC